MTDKVLPFPDQAQRTLAKEAKAHGCTPLWAEGMHGWRYHCGCPDNLHGSDQQCSVLCLESVKRNREAKSK